MVEKIVEVEVEGKKVRVYIGEISWYDAQELIGESTEIINGESRVKIEKLRINLVKYAVKKIEGIDIKKPEILMRKLNVRDGNKILKVALELNPLDVIMEV